MPEVSTVRSEDYDSLAEFLRDFPGFEKRSKESWLARLRGWWELNPAFSESNSRGWVLRDNGRIVGFFGAIPWQLQICGKEITAFAGTSWRVLPEYRGTSMALKSRQMEEHKAFLHMSINTHGDVVPLLKLLRYRPIDRGSGVDQQSILVLDFEKVLRGKFQKNGGALLAKIVTPFGWLGQAVRTRRLTQLADANVRNLACADVAFDDLWERTKSRYANTNVRTAEMVNWYCFAIEELKKKLLGYYEGEKLLGYMVLVPDTNSAMRALECVDLWFDPKGCHEKVLASLVCKAGECARENSFDRVVFPHFNQEIAASYIKLGLLQRPAWKRNEYLKGPPHIENNITPANSYFVGAQGDFGL